jgi:quinol-cytochrome oxidoreductase complex cytochrome b subunit
MSGHSNYEPKTGFERWLDVRLPIIRLAYDTVVDYPTPKNLNYWWTFGGILAFCLVVQIVTGVVLAMHYVPHASMAFDSVERIMRDVNHGWLIRYIHANGASMFFLAVYIHISRGMYYGSYKAPREVLWILGCIIYLLMMATAFMGYVLPWGQMSFYGAVVITSLFSAFDGIIPGLGTAITTWLWGGFAVDNPTLSRFFSLHYLLPFLIAGVVGLHIWALHVPGNNNPTGVNVKSKADTIPFHPYYTVKDGFAIVVFMIMFAWFVFFAPNALGHADNYVPANPLVTPAHIVPEWYFLPFYAILRAIPDKLMGVIAMFASIGALFVLPWLDTSKVRSMRYRPTARWFFLIFLVATMLLGWCGGQLPDDVVIPVGHNEETGLPVGLTVVWISRFLTAYYFAYFLLVLPILGLVEKPLPVPDSISSPVLSGGGHAIPAGSAASPEKKG